MTGGKYDRTNGRRALPKFCKNLDSCEERRNSWTLAKNLDSCEERINSSVRGKFFEFILAKKQKFLGPCGKTWILAKNAEILGFFRKKSWMFERNSWVCAKKLIGAKEAWIPKISENFRKFV